VTANVMIIIERMFPQSRERLFRAWVAPDELSQWRGSPGWHVDPDDVFTEERVGGRSHHVKIVDDDPDFRVTEDSIFIEYFDPDVFVAKQRITGDPEIDPNIMMELRVEFTKTGRDGTLVRIIQGPYESSIAEKHTLGWQRELQRLAEYLERKDQS